MVSTGVNRLVRLYQLLLQCRFVDAADPLQHHVQLAGLLSHRGQPRSARRKTCDRVQQDPTGVAPSATSAGAGSHCSRHRAVAEHVAGNLQSLQQRHAVADERAEVRASLMAVWLFWISRDRRGGVQQLAVPPQLQRPLRASAI